MADVNIVSLNGGDKYIQVEGMNIEKTANQYGLASAEHKEFIKKLSKAAS